MKIKKIVLLIVLIILSLAIILFIIRLFSPKHLDDLHPNIPCSKDLIKKSDYLAVIPLFENESIKNYPEWCSYINQFNKSLVMHGVYHTYNEFNTKREIEYIQVGKEEFKKCFGFDATEFKAPQLELSKKNKNILKNEFNFKVHTIFTQIFHKVYHCNDSGIISNKITDWI
ncbi:MAG TPA: DUF2334 domain-containing protein [Candidatus Paceibacterota bacterium]|nr:DUF2334 domain-containing protein [Candidatus Paceibacterota bacterium]